MEPTCISDNSNPDVYKIFGRFGILVHRMKKSNENKKLITHIQNSKSNFIIMKNILVDFNFLVVLVVVVVVVVVVFLQFGTWQVFGQRFLVQTEYLCPSLQYPLFLYNSQQRSGSLHFMLFLHVGSMYNKMKEN